MNLADIVLLSSGVWLLVPTAVFFLQVLFACLPRSKCLNTLPAENVSLAILIPAHNEESGISKTLASVQKYITSKDRVVVVADNCDDNTANVAKGFGVEVIERNDAQKKGKGYALDFGIRYLAKNTTPQVVFILDADCEIAYGDLQQLAQHTYNKQCPQQVLNMMEGHRDNRIKTKISQFAWIVKNKVRPLGWSNVGFPCQLMGTGMIFPWEQIASAHLATGNIVEDLKIGIELAMKGAKPAFYPECKVLSYFPESEQAQISQKRRWEHGHLTTIITDAPMLFIKGIAKLDAGLIAMALDLAIPPLALLTLLTLMFAATSLILFYTEVSMTLFPLVISFICLILLCVAITISWAGWGREVMGVRDFLMVPIYIFKKIPSYFAFLFKREKNWVRTQRDVNK